MAELGLHGCFSPGGVWIGYIRPGLEDVLLIDAAPVTGSLVSSTLFGCRDMYCTAWYGLCLACWMSIVSPSDHRALDGASVVEDRAGITFGVELYVPWDAPEAVVDISSAGVVPLRHIPDVIGLDGRREGAAESRVLQNKDACSVGVLVSKLSCRRSEFSRRCGSGHGRCAGITCFPSGVVDVDSAVAAGGH